jgi:hypothetical protein
MTKAVMEQSYFSDHIDGLFGQFQVVGPAQEVPECQFFYHYVKCSFLV